MAIKEEFDRRAAAERYWGASWNVYWDKDIAQREPAALEHWRTAVGDRPLVHRVWQYYFFEQWTALRQYANQRGIVLVGDMPIFVALDSADVWVNPQLFTLDEPPAGATRGGSATRLLQSHGPTLGKSALRLGGDAGG